LAQKLAVHWIRAEVGVLASVIAGLDAGIHLAEEMMDARIKPGYDVVC